MELVDLSHTVEDGLVTYPGLPAPAIGTHLSYEASHEAYAPGTEFHIGTISMVANTGTYLDAPSHRYRGGPDLADLPLSSVAGLPGLLVEADGLAVVDADALDGLDLAGRAVLVRTGWADHWGTARYFSGHPFLTGDAAAALVDGGAALVGIDSLNIDDAGDGTRPVHTALLGAGIPVVEHLTGLEHLDQRRPFRFSAVPVKVRGLGTFPVRAFAEIG